MKTIAYLEDDDVIESTDFCRPVDLIYIGQSDYLETTNTYGGGPLNHTRWLQVSRAHMDFFIGKTVGEFNRAARARGKPHQYTTEYEFVRGDLPEPVILGETALEEKARLLEESKSYLMPVGKYRNKPIYEISEDDPNYFAWAVNEGVIPYKFAFMRHY